MGQQRRFRQSLEQQREPLTDLLSRLIRLDTTHGKEAEVQRACARNSAPWGWKPRTRNCPKAFGRTRTTRHRKILCRSPAGPTYSASAADGAGRVGV